MPRTKPFISVSAVVSPAIVEELDRLAAANKVTRSTMVRKLLEGALTQRANERQEDAFDRLEQRLRGIENRFGSMLVKSIKFSAQATYLGMKNLEYSGKPQTDKYLSKHWKESQEFAGKATESKAKAQQRQTSEEKGEEG
jgi:predicted transcriptional regulator